MLLHVDWPNQKYSVTLSDGSMLNPDNLLSVDCWAYHDEDLNTEILLTESCSIRYSLDNLWLPPKQSDRLEGAVLLQVFIGGLCCGLFSIVLNADWSKPVNKPIEIRKPRVAADVGVCPICHDSMIDKDNDEKVVRLAGCAHIYHQTCLEGWLQHNTHCPYCRSPIETGLPDKITPRQQTILWLREVGSYAFWVIVAETSGLQLFSMFIISATTSILSYSGRIAGNRRRIVLCAILIFGLVQLLWMLPLMSRYPIVPLCIFFLRTTVAGMLSFALTSKRFDAPQQEGFKASTASVVEWISYYCFMAVVRSLHSQLEFPCFNYFSHSLG